MNNDKRALINGSRLIIESLARSGGDAFIGYPITPANYLYLYATQRFPSTYHAPDEITVLQWMSGMSAAGKLPVTATSFAGFALMTESINMAYMMELPMIIILAQRLGPSTGTATCGAQGDLLFIRGLISGGYPIPTLGISDFDDCWNMANKAAHIAVNLRTPVILLTSKEMVMTSRSYDINALPDLEPVKRGFYEGDEAFIPYKPQDNHVPSMLPLSSNKHQVRFTASTHNEYGILQHSTKEAMANTARLPEKMTGNIKEYSYYELNEDSGADTIIFSYGISAVSSREAVNTMRKNGKKVSLLVAKTLLPLLDEYLDILKKYKKVVIAEENLLGQYSELLYGKNVPDNVSVLHSIGKMITPNQIISGVTNE